MNTKPSGGPAFPCDRSKQVGMTLRDYFAGQALQGMLAANMPRNGIALDAYQIADAMIEARKS